MARVQCWAALAILLMKTQSIVGYKASELSN